MLNLTPCPKLRDEVILQKRIKEQAKVSTGGRGNQASGNGEMKIG
jgi:hypothetical protein